MKKIFGTIIAIFILTFCGAEMTTQAATEERIQQGIYVDSISLGGMTAREATETLEGYVESLMEKEITFLAADENTIVVSAQELGLEWRNTGLVQEALALGVKGNVITRYKAQKDLIQNNVVFHMQFGLDESLIREILEEQGCIYDQSPVEAGLSKEEDEFVVVPSENGYALDVDKSTEVIVNTLLGEWDHEACEIPLVIEVSYPLHSTDELAQVQDILGSCTTSLSGSAAGRINNVRNGCNKVSGITVYPGEVVSVHDLMAPYTAKNGYDMAGAYISGRVVDVVGGGVCQVSTTLYNAVLNAELEVVERHNHSMTVSYVPVSADAAMAESAGKDFQFANNTEYPIYVDGYVSGKKITFNIYGKETRDPSRSVRYVSEVLEVIPPAADVIYTDPGQPIGYIVTEGSHTGYKAKLWKIVTIDGVDQPKEQVNSSNYKQSPRMATVGTATSDPEAYEKIMAAIASGNIDVIKGTIAALTAAPQ